MAKRKKKSKEIPSWVWFITLVLAVLFLGFLLYLNTLPAKEQAKLWPQQQPAKTQPAKQAAKPAPQAKAEPKPVAKPSPKPDYDFYKLLEDQKVEVPKVEEYKSTPKTQKLDYQYRLQVASFRSQEDADSLRAVLILEEGMQAEVRSSVVNGNTWYRVFVGPYSNRSVMNKAQDKLASRGISPLELKEPKP